MLAFRETIDEDLWRQHADELLRFATVLVGPTDAYDVVADVMLRVGAARQLAGRGQQAGLPVPRRRQSGDRSAAQPAAPLERDLAAVGPARPAQPDDFADVRRAVCALSPMQRAVVYFTYWEDLPERAIAEMLQLSPGTVHHALDRARAILRKALVMNDELDDRRLRRAFAER